MFVDVALNLPLEGLFTYSVPAALQELAQRGHRVLVPFRSKIELGVVVAVHEIRPPHLKRVRAIADVLDHQRFLPEALLALCEWIATYYHANVGDSVHLAVPSALAPPKAEALWTRTDTPCVTPLSDAQRAIVDVLATAPHSTAMLRATLPALRGADLEVLEEHQLVHLADTSGARRVRTDLRLRRTDKAPEKKLGDKQALMLDFLDEHKEAWLSELRDLYAITRANVRSLEARDLLTSEEVAMEFDPFGDAAVKKRATDPELTATQASAVDAIAGAIDGGRSETFLLHGVTGSGKTEVYVRAIRAARAGGRNALVLLPEIALTPQFIGVLRAALDEELAVLHSALTPAQRRSQWLKIRRGDIGVVVGARSSLFSPLENIGLILVDEEHDGSFKQHEGVRYNARDAALVLAKKFNAVTVLGSATPSLETLYNARAGRYQILRMPDRVANRPMPAIELIDLRGVEPTANAGGGPLISDVLHGALRRAVDAGEQAILFLNRRGFSPEVRCTGCGEALECKACERAMTFHQRGRVMMCHHCGHSAPIPRACPTCGEQALEMMGAGTERLEESLVESLEGMRVGRLDRDTSRAKTMEKVLTDFRAGELDILVGTQMVTKGHDFPNVTLVGVLAGDQSLTFADFRGGERTFQLLTQVAGRAGRGEKPGRVIIQTWKPDHPVLQAVVRGDFDAMAAHELRARQREALPPFGHAALIRLNGPDYSELYKGAERIQRWMALLPGTGVAVGPPLDAPIPRVRERYRMQLLLRSRSRGPLHDVLHQFRSFVAQDAVFNGLRDVRWSIDVDPQSLS